MVHKETQVNVDCNLNQINSWCINYNQYIQNQIRNKFCMKAINYSCFKLEQKATSNFTKSNSPPWVVFTFFKLYKWYQFAQNIYFCCHDISLEKLNLTTRISTQTFNKLLFGNFSGSLSELQYSIITHVIDIWNLLTYFNGNQQKDSKWMESKG